jgi:hypothetical protein
MLSRHFDPVLYFPRPAIPMSNWKTAAAKTEALAEVFKVVDFVTKFSEGTSSTSTAPT